MKRESSPLKKPRRRADPVARASIMTEEEQRRAILLYRQGLSVPEVAAQISRSKPTVLRALHLAGVKVRSTSTPAHVPNPDEIEAVACQIRRGWSEEQEQSRRVEKPAPWMPPVCTIGIENDFGRMPAHRLGSEVL
jgi:hypothetical protein